MTEAPQFRCTHIIKMVGQAAILAALLGAIGFFFFVFLPALGVG